MFRGLLIFVILFLSVSNIFSQTISGYVYSEENTPLPFVNIYIKYTQIGTITDENGRFFLQLDEGDYEVVFSTLGYESKTLPILIYKKDLVKNIWLESSFYEISQVEVSSKRRDPAYEIIQNAIKFKKENNKSVQTSRCNVYIKAKEIISEKERKRREKLKEQDKIEEENSDKEIEPEDPEKKLKAEERKRKAEQKKLAHSMNMVEIQMQRNYQYPNKVKEIRQAYTKYGNSRGLFFLNSSEADFNFYNNLIRIDNLNEIPLISPLNPTSVISYKFKLINSSVYKNQLVYHIKVIPRKKGNATFHGYIDIVDASFAIKSVDLAIEKGGLMFYDNFTVKQKYDIINDSIWIITRQEFDYFTKAGKRNFKGNTVAKYDSIELGVKYPKRYFKNEVSVTTQEAYERDSSYWEDIRPEPLSVEEQRIIFIQDSIKAVYNTKEYLDSIDRAYNKVTIGDLALWGVGFFNREKKRHIMFPSVTSLVNPFSIGGMRAGFYCSAFQKFEDHSSIYAYTSMHYGFRNQDVKGRLYTRYLYNAMKQSSISLSTGLGFDEIQSSQSFTGLMDRANYVESLFFDIYHSTELFNGFYFGASVFAQNYKPIDSYEFGPISENFVENNVPRSFEPYNQFSISLSFSYVPFQKYMTEPKRKIILGSDWPKFTFRVRQGIPDIINSDVNFTYIAGSISQTYKISTLGSSTAKVASGKFISTKKMHYENYKIFPRGDDWFFSSPMQNQLQDTTLITDDVFFEAHYVHHFNGALLNNIPFIKKIKVFTTAGANYTYIHDVKYHYIDFYAGLEKSIRIQRQRFRLGVYFVYGGSNNRTTRPTIQFSISHYNKREKSWEY